MSIKYFQSDIYQEAIDFANQFGNYDIEVNNGWFCVTAW